MELINTRRLKFRVYRYCYRLEKKKFYYLDNLKIARDGGADIVFSEEDAPYCDVSIDNITEEYVQQFTGLRDSDHRDIYEGDLLIDNYNYIFEVFWLDWTASFEIRPIKDYDFLEEYDEPPV